MIKYGEDGARFVTVEGWVSSKGHFYGSNEHLARYDGCTHSPCTECGEFKEKGWTLCPSCREKKRKSKYRSMPKKEWDRITPVYSDSTGKYFYDVDSVNDYCIDNQCAVNDLDLIICEPEMLRALSEDYWADNIPEDYDLSDELIDAINVLNGIVKKIKPQLWYPGKFAAIVS